MGGSEAGRNFFPKIYPFWRKEASLTKIPFLCAILKLEKERRNLFRVKLLLISRASSTLRHPERWTKVRICKVQARLVWRLVVVP